MNGLSGPPLIQRIWERGTRGMSRETEMALGQAAIVGGFAGAAGVANIVDEKFLKGRLGFKKKDSAASAFLRGSLVGLAGMGAIIYVLKETGALQGGVFGPIRLAGLGSPMHTKDMKNESSSSHKADMPHVSKNLPAPKDYLWVENADSRYLVIDPKYAL